MDIKDLKLKTDQELSHLVIESREKLRKLRFDLSERKLKNVGDISGTRKMIARILTLMKERSKK